MVSPEGDVMLISVDSFKNVEPGLITENAVGSPWLSIPITLILASLEPPINV